MPTPGGLPKPGERWRYSQKLPPDWKEESVEVTVLERSRGDYWSMRVRFDDGRVDLWVDPAYWLSKGQLTYVGNNETLTEVGTSIVPGIWAARLESLGLVELTAGVPDFDKHQRVRWKVDRFDELEAMKTQSPDGVSVDECPNCDDQGYTDTHYPVKDDRGCEILTVGALRKMLDGVDDLTQVVMDDNDGWYVNVTEVIIPAGDEPAFSAVTLMCGEGIDTRQF